MPQSKTVIKHLQSIFGKICHQLLKQLADSESLLETEGTGDEANKVYLLSDLIEFDVVEDKTGKLTDELTLYIGDYLGRLAHQSTQPSEEEGIFASLFSEEEKQFILAQTTEFAAPGAGSPEDSEQALFLKLKTLLNKLELTDTTISFDRNEWLSDAEPEEVPEETSGFNPIGNLISFGISTAASLLSSSKPESPTDDKLNAIRRSMIKEYAEQMQDETFRAEFSEDNLGQKRETIDSYKFVSTTAVKQVPSTAAEALKSTAGPLLRDREHPNQKLETNKNLQFYAFLVRNQTDGAQRKRRFSVSGKSEARFTGGITGQLPVINQINMQELGNVNQDGTEFQAETKNVPIGFDYHIPEEALDLVIGSANAAQSLEEIQATVTEEGKKIGKLYHAAKLMHQHLKAIYPRGKSISGADVNFRTLLERYKSLDGDLTKEKQLFDTIENLTSPVEKAINLSPENLGEVLNHSDSEISREYTLRALTEEILGDTKLTAGELLDLSVAASSSMLAKVSKFLGAESEEFSLPQLRIALEDYFKDDEDEKLEHLNKLIYHLMITCKTPADFTKLIEAHTTLLSEINSPEEVVRTLHTEYRTAVEGAKESYSHRLTLTGIEAQLQELKLAKVSAAPVISTANLKQLATKSEEYHLPELREALIAFYSPDELEAKLNELLIPILNTKPTQEAFEALIDKHLKLLKETTISVDMFDELNPAHQKVINEISDDYTPTCTLEQIEKWLAEIDAAKGTLAHDSVEVKTIENPHVKALQTLKTITVARERFDKDEKFETFEKNFHAALINIQELLKHDPPPKFANSLELLAGHINQFNEKGATLSTDVRSKIAEKLITLSEFKTIPDLTIQSTKLQLIVSQIVELLPNRILPRPSSAMLIEGGATEVRPAGAASPQRPPPPRMGVSSISSGSIVATGHRVSRSATAAPSAPAPASSSSSHGGSSSRPVDNNTIDKSFYDIYYVALKEQREEGVDIQGEWENTSTEQNAEVSFLGISEDPVQPTLLQVSLKGQQEDSPTESIQAHADETTYSSCCLLAEAYVAYIAAVIEKEIGANPGADTKVNLKDFSFEVSCPDQVVSPDGRTAKDIICEHFDKALGQYLLNLHEKTLEQVEGIENSPKFSETAIEFNIQRVAEMSPPAKSSITDETLPSAVVQKNRVRKMR